MLSTALRHGAVFLFAATTLPAPAQPTGTALGGRLVPLLPPSARIAVLFFTASDCPISNRYQPEMHRLEQQYTTQGVAFWFVYPNLTETPAAIQAHQAAFAGPQPQPNILTDPTGQLARLAVAKVTPEAAILSPTGKLLYTGRIDDRYVSIGNERPQATHHDLELAVRAALAGNPIPQPTGPPVGCGIVSTR